MAPLALGLGTCKAYIESNLTNNIHSLQDFFQDVANKGVLNLTIAGKDEEPTDQQLQGRDSTLGIISSHSNNSYLMPIFIKLVFGIEALITSIFSMPHPNIFGQYPQAMTTAGRRTSSKVPGSTSRVRGDPSTTSPRRLRFGSKVSQRDFLMDGDATSR